MTKTQIVVNTVRFNRKTGRLCGDSGWDSSSARVATAKDVVEINRQTAIEKLSGLKADDFKHLPDDEITCIVSILTP